MISVICDLFCGLVLSRRTLVYKATHLCVYIGVSRWFVLILRLQGGRAAVDAACRHSRYRCPSHAALHARDIALPSRPFFSTKYL